LTMNPKLILLNKQVVRHGCFILTCEGDSISQEVAEQEIASIDSIPEVREPITNVFERAILHNKTQNFNASLDDYAKLIQKDPQFSLAYFNRANTHYNMISFLKSITDLNNTVVTIGGTTPQSQQTQRKIIQNYDEVVNDYKECIRLDPDFSYAWYNLALVDITTRDYAGAIKDFSNAIGIDPKFSEAYYNRGLTYIYMQQTEEGCRDLSKAGEIGVQRSYLVIKKYCNQ